MMERFELATSRIKEMKDEKCVSEKYQDYFQTVSCFLEQMIELKEEIEKGIYASCSLEELRKKNKALYWDILPEQYETSYGNPVYAAKVLGKEMGQLLSFLYTELRGLIVYAFEKREWDFLVGLELFLQVYSEFQGEEYVSPQQVQQILYWYINDYCAEFVEHRIKACVDPVDNFAVNIIAHADLSDLRFLYQYGEYITEQEEQVAAFLNTLSIEEIQAMAHTYTEGYRKGFEITGKDLSKKKTVEIRYCIGFERMMREAMKQFQAMGLEPVIYRSASHSVNKRQHMRIGYTGANPNPQFDYDHKNDISIYLNDDFVGRKLRATQNGYEKYKKAANVHGGPAVLMTFGETPFVPKACMEATTLTEKQQKMQVHLNNETAQITNRYIIGEERSFTIIAYPVPAIGDKFEEIFKETVKINTLDYDLYLKIQEKLIDVLNQGRCVKIKGKNGNKTDLCVQLYPLKDLEKETIFENCVADVNIPVGEVFTSPVLKGTNGCLHVKKVFLEELQYHDLEIMFTDGMISSYTCKNFASEEENKKYMKENILFNHETLPLGEFAIGTNTTAYKMAKTYDIADKLPILIAEKMGPHFAVGDTCYTWAEDTKVYNPDGKEIVAKDNEVSILRKTDMSKAYFGCHTDITIPYDELDSIHVETKDGNWIPVILDGKFVVPGTEILNEQL